MRKSFLLCSFCVVFLKSRLNCRDCKGLKKNLEILCSLVIYTPNFKHDFLSKRSAYTRQNTVYLAFNVITSLCFYLAFGLFSTFHNLLQP